MQKSFAAAEQAALEAKDRALARAGKAVPDAIAAFELAGLSAQEQIQFARALDHFRAAAALTSRKRDPIEWARVQHEIAYVLYELGQASDVEAILRDMAATHERVLGAEHPETSASRNNLAIALRAQGRNAEAEQEHRAVLTVRARVLSAEHPEALMSRNNLASALYSQGKNTEAEQEHRAALTLRERVLGAEHPDVFESCYNLAVSLWAQDKPKAALEYARRARDGCRRVLGEEQPDAKDAVRLCERLEAALAR